MSKRTHGTVNFGRRKIRFQIVHSERRKKTIAIQIDRDGQVTIRAPAGTSRQRITDIVQSKREWIHDRMRARERWNLTFRPKEFVEGESFLYLGRNYRLKIRDNGKVTSPLTGLFGRYFVVGIPRCRSAKKKRSRVRNALIEWYRKRARDRISERIHLLAQKIETPLPSKVLVRSQTRRWASCSKSGDLRFNWRIIMAPLSLVDYVVAHELCHMKYRDHSRAFWHLLQTVMPDYEERRSCLTSRGAEFDF